MGDSAIMRPSAPVERLCPTAVAAGRECAVSASSAAEQAAISRTAISEGKARVIRFSRIRLVYPVKVWFVSGLLVRDHGSKVSDLSPGSAQERSTDRVGGQQFKGLDQRRRKRFHPGAGKP